MHQLAKALIELHKLEQQSASSAIASSANRSGAKSPRKGSNLATQLLATTNAANSSSISPLDEAVQLFELASEVAKEVNSLFPFMSCHSLRKSCMIILLQLNNMAPPDTR